MNTRVVVDASVWVSWLITEDVNHEASLLWMRRYRAEGGFLVAPAFMLIEVAASMSRQLGKIVLAKETARNLQAASEISIVPLDASLVAMSANTAADLKLRAGDATYVTVASQLNIPLISWDKEQLDRAASLVSTYTPSTYIFPTASQNEPGGASDT